MIYNPNEDVDTEELIHSGFHSQRLADGLESNDATYFGINVAEKTHEFFKSLADMRITFRTGDYQCREHAEKASACMDDLRDIFRDIRIAASTPSGASLTGPSRVRPSQQDASQAGPSGIRTSQPTSPPLVLSRFTALNAPAATSSPPASPSSQANDTLDDVELVDVTISPSSSSEGSPEHVQNED